MKKYKVISIDMFGTLADTDSIRYRVWREFLKERYTDQLADTYWDRGNELVFKSYETLAMDKERYFPARRSFEIAYSALFSEIGLDFNPEEAARVLAVYHSLSTPHPDVSPFLRTIGRHYPVCLSSDTDSDMLGPLTTLYPFDHIFTSEKLQCYKANNDGRFFSAVVDHYKVKPEVIFHIGDGRLETVSARNAGLTACWLNRNRTSWNHETRPDYEVKSLLETIPIINREY
jgi:FMN hydrolase / 5-amino-6-(5-phospho-D-ribitylamino)uracil phosphatase